MNDIEVKEFLLNEFPWYLTDASVSLLRSATSIDELRNLTVRLGRDLKLPINAEYEAYVKEFYSIYAFEEFHGESSRQKLYAEKKRNDEAAEMIQLRVRLFDPKFGSKVLNADGTRRDLDSMTLPELRRASQQMDEHKRMNAMDVNSLRREHLAKHPSPARRADGYQMMPQELVLPPGLRTLNGLSNGFTATVMSPEFIRLYGAADIASDEYHHYRFKWCRIYGPNQLTERSRA